MLHYKHLDHRVYGQLLSQNSRKAAHNVYKAMNVMANHATDDDSSTRIRLHITPFNPELLDRILAPLVRKVAENISFHSVQTFPERGFGYVDLPVMEAQKLKQKLNGSTLKGTKVHVEEAKPERKRKALTTEGPEEDLEKKEKKRAKREKRKVEQGVLSGHEIEAGRRVKRGWTDGDLKDARKKGKKKEHEAGQSEDGQLLFRTKLPPNAVPVVDDGKKSKKDKSDKDGKRAVSKTVVREFQKSKKSLDITGVQSENHGALNYEDGRGWVNASGEVVERERTSKKPKRKSKRQDEEPARDAKDEDVTMADQPAPERGPKPATPVADDMVEEVAPDSPPQPAPVDTPLISPRPSKDVHPLEALFKRPVTSPVDIAKPRPKPIDTSFSFFDPEAADEEDEEGKNIPPQTPHTRRDLEWRSIRSAAPTPDTAAIGRKFSFPLGPDDDEMDEDEDQDTEIQNSEQAAVGADQDTSEGKQEEESAFRKFFYENRGDFNRGWKKRRRDERKQKRQRENRRLNEKIA